MSCMDGTKRESRLGMGGLRGRKNARSVACIIEGYATLASPPEKLAGRRGNKSRSSNLEVSPSPVYATYWDACCRCLCVIGAVQHGGEIDLYRPAAFWLET